MFPINEPFHPKYSPHPHSAHQPYDTPVEGTPPPMKPIRVKKGPIVIREGPHIYFAWAKVLLLIVFIVVLIFFIVKFTI